MPWTLCTKADVMAIHPCTESELKDEWSVDVEALIRQHMGQPYLGVSQVITDEYHNGDDTNLIWVKNPPIISVESIICNEIVVLPASYVVFDNYIQLKTTQVFPKGSLNVLVSYTSGSAAVPDMVRFCAASMIVAMLNYRRRWGADSSLKWGNPEKQVGDNTPNENVGLATHLTTIMKALLRRPYLRVR